MARIRTIKPEFPQSESMGRVSRDSRLLFIQLWTLADDVGRLRGDSRMLARLLYPYDDGEDGHARTTRKDVDGWLTELQTEGCILRYENGGAQYIQICNWLSHQKIDKPSSPKVPGSDDEGSRVLAKPREVSSGDQGREGKGSRTKDLTSAAAPPACIGPVSREAVEEPSWRLDFKLAYPNRAGDTNWRGAWKAANVRIGEGHTPAEFIAGARRYAEFVRATGKAETEFVQQASTFLGPRKPFLLPWLPPAIPVSAMDEILSRAGRGPLNDSTVIEHDDPFRIAN